MSFARMDKATKARIIAARRAVVPPLEARFWSKVDKRGPDDCWEWTAYKCKLGYGRLAMDGKVRLAHHVSCVLHGIPIPGYPKSKNCIDHKCGNRGCVNPAHLRVVPQAENCTTLARAGVFKRNREATHCIHGHALSGWNLAIHPSKGRPARGCITCYPRLWRFAVIPREKPPRARSEYVGPFRGDGQ